MLVSNEITSIKDIDTKYHRAELVWETQKNSDKKMEELEFLQLSSVSKAAYQAAHRLALSG